MMVPLTSALLLVSHFPGPLRLARSRLRLKEGLMEPEIIMYACMAFKLLQLCVYGVEISRLGGIGAMATSPAILSAAAALVFGGQYINMLVIHKLGVNGVFFGNVYGYKTNCCTDFPYNVCKNPQYYGVLASITGLFALWSNRPGWWSVPLLETVYYFTESQFEVKPLAQLVRELRLSFIGTESAVAIDDTSNVVFISFHGSNKAEKFSAQMSNALAIVSKIVSQMSVSVVMAGDFNHTVRVADRQTVLCCRKDSGEQILAYTMSCKAACTLAIESIPTSSKTRVMSSQVDKIGKKFHCTIDYVLVFGDDSCAILGSAVYSVDGSRILGASDSSVNDSFDHHAVVADVRVARDRVVTVVTVNLCGESLIGGSRARNIYEFLPSHVASSLPAGSLEQYLKYIRDSVDKFVRQSGWAADELSRDPYRSLGVFDVHPDYKDDILGNVEELKRLVEKRFPPSGGAESRAHIERVEMWCECWRGIQLDPHLEPFWTAWNRALASRGYGAMTQQDAITRLVRGVGREAFLLTQETRIAPLSLLRAAGYRFGAITISSLADLLAGRLYGSIIKV